MSKSKNKRAQAKQRKRQAAHAKTRNVTHQCPAARQARGRARLQQRFEELAAPKHARAFEKHLDAGPSRPYVKVL